MKLFKRHQPYHESDHVLILIYNVATGGTRYQDIEMRRHSVSFLEAVGAEKIPAPSTAGDFVRRFQAQDVGDLMEAVNESCRKVWAQHPASFFQRAEIDVDGSIAPTSGECKEGMDGDQLRQAVGQRAADRDAGPEGRSALCRQPLGQPTLS